MVNLIKYDLRIGIKDRISNIVFPIAVFCLASIFTKGLNLGERFAIMLTGNYAQLDTENGGIPLYWMLIHIGCLLFSVEYPIRDLSLHGRQIVVRSQSKYKWWLSKCVWCLVNTFIYYLVGIITEAVICIAFNEKLTFELRTIAISGSLEISVSNIGERVSALQAVIVLVILPLLTMYALSLIQMIIGVRTNHIIALLGGMGIIAVSLYFQSPLLIGNYSMLQRSSVFNRTGLDWSTGIIIMVIEIVIIICIGIEVFNRIDILEPKKNGE